MVHVLQHPQFSVGSLGVNGRLERSGDLLDGDTEVSTVSTPFGGVISRTDLDIKLQGEDRTAVGVGIQGDHTASLA